MKSLTEIQKELNDLYAEAEREHTVVTFALSLAIVAMIATTLLTLVL